MIARLKRKWRAADEAARRRLALLTPAQAATVVAVFWFSAIAAVALGYAFFKWNGRTKEGPALGEP